LEFFILAGVTHENFNRFGKRIRSISISSHKVALTSL
jgi:hypothetical protein